MIWFVLACTGEVDLDDELSLAHAQVIGTHNSYHVSGPGDFGPYEYDHRPLDEQIDLGIRQFELDLHWIDDEWAVIHEPAFDPGTTCPRLDDCLDSLRTGSERNAHHLPILVMLEIKESFVAESAELRLQALIGSLSSRLGTDRILDAAEIQGGAPTLADAMTSGWPSLTGQRGRFILLVHENGPWAESGRVLALPHVFYDAYGDTSVPWAAIHSSNDPTNPEIADLAAAGHLVRTRADSNTIEARDNDTTHRDRAFSSGAHFISTDFPEPHAVTGYQVTFQDVARCNPVSAPESCTAAALESATP